MAAASSCLHLEGNNNLSLRNAGGTQVEGSEQMTSPPDLCARLLDSTGPAARDHLKGGGWAALLRDLVVSPGTLGGGPASWAPHEWSLDLHGLTRVAAVLAALMWLSEVGARLAEEEQAPLGASMRGAGTIGGTAETGGAPYFKAAVGRRDRPGDHLGLPERVVIVTGWGKHSREAGKAVVRDALCELLRALESPFVIDRQNPGCLTANCSAVRKWLDSPPDLVSPSQTRDCMQV